MILFLMEMKFYIYSYKNKAIKINFTDRTMLKIDSKHNKIYLLNKFGDKFIFKLENLNSLEGANLSSDFHFYFDNAIQFYNFCFMSIEQKRQIQENLNYINQISKASLDGIKDHKILSKPMQSSLPMAIGIKYMNSSYGQSENFNRKINEYDISR